MGRYIDLGEGKYKLIVEAGYDRKGNRKRKTRIVKVSGKRELNKLLTYFEIEVQEAMNKVIKEKVLFEDFVKDWKVNYVEPNLERSTKNNSYQVLSHVTPYFKGAYLDEISTLDILNFFSSEIKEGRKSLEKKYNLLLSIFSKAVAWNVLDHNPMHGVDKPKIQRKKKHPYTWEEMQELSKHLKDLDPYHQRLIKVTVECALRRGEVLGIAEDVLDFENNRILIKRSLNATPGDGCYLKSTKTSDETYLHVSDELMEELKLQLHVAKKNRIKNGAMWQGFKDQNGNEVLLLFADEFGVPYLPTSVTRFWGRFIKRTGLRPISFHDLRHSSASILNRKGVRNKSLQNRLRHKNIKTTMNVYVHEEENDDKLVAEMFKGIWS